MIAGRVKRTINEIMVKYNIDPALETEIYDALMTLYAKRRVRPGRAVLAATLYVLAKHGVDIAKHDLMPSHREKRASIAYLISAIASHKDNRDDTDEFIRTYARAISIAERQKLPDSVIERVREILWAVRPLLLLQNEPSKLAKEAIRLAMARTIDIEFSNRRLSVRALLAMASRLNNFNHSHSG